MKTLSTSTLLAACLTVAVGAAFAFGGPKGLQFLAGENLSDAAVAGKLAEQMTNDTKGKNWGKVNKVIVPAYYLEFRTSSSGKALKKGLKDISVNATVDYTNPDKAVMESIATEGRADLKAKLAAAGFEVVEAGDLKALDKYKDLKTLESGTLGESTVQPIGWAKFKAIFAAADGAPIYTVIPGEPGWGMSAAYASYGVDGTLWKNAGGDGVGIVRSRMLIDFVTFTGESGKTYDMDGWKNYANISATPQVTVWVPSLCVTRTYIFFGGKVAGDNLGCVNVVPEIQLASKMPPATLGKLEDKNETWLFTADNAKYKEAALEQIKVANSLLVAKAKAYKK
ncbi:MAG: hypothetical protein FD126_900 [Elusimicrobia bacterium]|nr:MAG: hypothetical protein FD126_900 [Elusimicrobiota bacterium]